MKTYTFDEIVEQISNALAEMEGKQLADLYNREIGEGLVYLGDDMFEQENDE